MNIGPLLVLYLLANHGRKDEPRPERPPGPPLPPGPMPYDYPPAPAPRNVPGPSPSSEWLPYKPLNPLIVARAEEILKDPTKHVVIEADPTKPGGSLVRYIRTTDNPPGHTSVTAWLPNPKFVQSPTEDARRGTAHPGHSR